MWGIFAGRGRALARVAAILFVAALFGGLASAAWGSGTVRVVADARDCGMKNGTSAATSYCGDSNLYVGSASTRRQRSLLYFAVAGSLPPNVEITDATVHAYVTARSTSRAIPIEARELSRAWTSSATWNKATSSVAWTTAGGDFAATALGYSASASAAGQWLSWDVSAAVNGWVAGANNGLLLKQVNEGSAANELQLASASTSDSAQRPYIEIAYREAPVTDPATPAGMVFAGVKTSDDDWGLYRANTDGSNPQLVQWTPINVEPALSPDGYRVTYSSDDWTGTTVNVLDLRTGSTEAIPTSPCCGEPRWFPDGSRIIFGSSTGPQTIQADGTGLTPIPLELPAGVETPVSGFTVAPDGKQLAFSAYANSGPTSYKRAVFIADIDGSSVRQVTSPSTSYPGQVRFSRDGERLIYYDYGDTGSVHIVGTDGTGDRTVADSLAHFYGMDWAPDDTLAVSHNDGAQGPVIIDRIGIDGERLGPMISDFLTTSAASFPQAFNDTALLERYRPQLRYHSAESYRADSAETMTLASVPPEGQDESWANNLERENGAVLATSDPFLPYPALTLAALPGGDSALYPWGDSALDSDRIDARNGTYQQDAALMHQNPALANRVYARATHAADGKLWLQYWFFYYYSQGTFGVGDHEADWEMIQIGLRNDLTPDVATYAQHSGAESCTWDRVPKYDGPSGISPVVFVGLGNHASLFHPLVGTYDPGSSERVRPEIDQQIGDVEPGWANWRGRWGGSDSTIRSPGRQGSKWDDPTGFNTAAGDCPSDASGTVTARASQRAKSPRARGRALPAPRLNARRSAKRVLVRYRYSHRAWKRLPRRTSVVLSVRGSKRGSLPRNVIFRLRHRVGQRRVGLPLSPGPYVVQGQTFTRAGAQSRPTTIQVK